MSLSAVSGMGVASAAPISTLLTPGSLTIGTDPTYPPFIFLKGETLGGFEVEVMNEVARRLDLKPVWT
ncbi:transporter substrate-binding domain-containing protein [Deinococcus sp. AJ005]|uniref:transporter substrate-binding domain-containing protein n=1 Tax=Deinococcus sp. AJ005 TaxID=2652443 RepID=UPI00210478AB|nr:transporter substrate-binding domain-containing protein [Deinococcus sp. AJ005]